MKTRLGRKGLVVSLLIVFLLSQVPILVTSVQSLDIDLPPPMSVDVSAEEVLSCRSSVREFTEEPITDEELSTILWAAYGLRDDGNQTVPGVEGIYGVQIYVVREDGVYTYDPVDHQLVFYKSGDYRYVAQWEAPAVLGMVWNTTLSSDEHVTCAVMGEIGQNIQFMAYALDLGSVINADLPGWSLSEIGLPSHEEPKIIVPLGHPRAPYRFLYLPLWISFLPRIRDSGVNLTTVLQELTESTRFYDDHLTRRDLNSIVWSSYGYSPYLDKSKPERKYVTRHRTVPSAHGYYPMQMYAVTPSGVYRYVPGLWYVDPYGLPIVTFLLKIRYGDKRSSVAQASQGYVATAPLILVSVLDLENTAKWDDFSGEEFRWLWYYEAGASVHNVLVEATALGLSGKIVIPTDVGSLQSLLRLNNDQIPFFVVPVGKAV